MTDEGTPRWTMDHYVEELERAHAAGQRGWAEIEALKRRYGVDVDGMLKMPDDDADALTDDDDAMLLGGHEPGYSQNRDGHGRFAPGDGRESSGEGSGHDGGGEMAHGWAMAAKARHDARRAAGQHAERVATLRQHQAGLERESGRLADEADAADLAARRARSAWRATARDLASHGDSEDAPTLLRVREASLHRAYESAEEEAGQATLRAMEARYRADGNRVYADRLERATPNPYHPDMAALGRATTTGEVEAWCRDNLGGLETAFHGADVGMARDAAAELGDLATAYPEAMRELRFAGFDEAAPAAYRAAAGVPPGGTGERQGWAGVYVPDEHVMLLSGYTMRDPARMRRIMDAAIANHANVGRPGVSPTRIAVRHEFGHVIEEALRDHADVAYQRARLRQFALGQVHDPERLSDYATKLPEEHFAEGFAAARYGTEAQMGDPYTFALNDMVKTFWGEPVP